MNGVVLTVIRRGAWGRDRTDYTRIFSPMLYHLSYPSVADEEGIEPVFRGFGGHVVPCTLTCSFTNPFLIHLEYDVRSRTASVQSLRLVVVFQ